METGVQEVYWGALLGWTPDEEGRGQNRKRERSGRKAVTVKASAHPQGGLKLARPCRVIPT